MVDRRRLEQRLHWLEEHLHLVRTSAGLALWAYVFEGPRAERCREIPDAELGLPIDDTSGWPTLPDVLARIGVLPPYRAVVVAAVQTAVDTNTPDFEVEYPVAIAGGPVRWRLARGTIVRDPSGAPVTFSGLSIDITERRAAEEDARRHEDEVQRALKAAESANRAKDEFLANVSHEIRTPMNAILGMTELALDATETPHQRQLLSTVKVAARNLLHVINDLLDFSKITAGKLSLDPADFSLRAAIGETVRALAVRAHRKSLELVCHVHQDLPDLYLGDVGRVRQVLMNLIGNAIKFTAQGEVVVEVTREPETTPDDDAVALRFTVRDTGIGIAPEKHASIFRAFEQEDVSTTRRFGGTGLGLTISAQLAALMGGRITVESEPGRGSTFTFTARIERSARSEWTGVLSPAPEVVPGGRPLRILVAEDNELNVAVVRELLDRRGHRVEVAGDGRVALELVGGEAAYDLMLLDLHMPEMDGFEVVEAIRQRERGTTNHLPIIALTARSSKRDRERALAAGMDDFLSKPIRVEALWDAIDRATSRVPGKRLSRLLDPSAILRMCGGRPEVLDRLCEVFRRTVDDHLARSREALDQRDLPRLDVAAHKLAGTLSAFSTVAGMLASDLEDAAAADQLERCLELFARLETTCAALLAETSGLTFEALGL